MEAAVVDHMGRWFGAGLTACSFAGWAIKKRTLPLVVLEASRSAVTSRFAFP
jgi:hypothetical protein